MINVLDGTSAKVIALGIDGEATMSNEEEIIPMLNALMEKETPLSLLLVLDEKLEYEYEQIWEYLDFVWKANGNWAKIALIANDTWETKILALDFPATAKETRFFGIYEQEQAWKWLKE